MSSPEPQPELYPPRIPAKRYVLDLGYVAIPTDMELVTGPRDDEDDWLWREEASDA